MSMVINNNIPALQSYNIVNSTSNALQKSIAKLSSGLRINSAADDAAGLAISEKMRSQVRGLDRAVANTQDGISLIQTAEGALSETHSILQRMRELAVQAANDTLTQQDRSYIQVEMDQLKDEVTRIGNTTQFNKKKLLNGDSAALWSSDNLETKAIINGGLRDIDQFGQKKSVEGNYKIRVKADPGQAEVQKSDIMKIKHENVVMNKMVNTPKGVKDVEINTMAPGHYTVKTNTASSSETAITGSYGIGGDLYTNDVSVSVAGAGTGQQITSIKVSLSDGTTLWEKTNIAAADLPAGATTAQIGEFLGAGNSTGVPSGYKDEIIANAKAAGITLTISNDGNTWKATSLDKEVPTFSITVGVGSGTAPVATVGNTKSGPVTKTASDAFTLTSGTDNTQNASVLFEVTGIDTNNKTVTLKAAATMTSQTGKNSSASMDNIVIEEGKTVKLKDIGDMSVQLDDLSLISTVGSKFVGFYQATKKEDSGQTDMNLELEGAVDSTWADSWSGGPFNGETVKYKVNADGMADSEVHLKNYILNGKTGEVTEGDVTLITDTNFKTTAKSGELVVEEKVMASFDAAYIGQVARGDVKLRDLDKFWNSEGTFMLDDAKTLTISQGDGKTASITLYANDTLDDVATKLNNAIAVDLGQSSYVDDASHFATFVSAATHDAEAVNGTFVIRSAVPGKQGELTFSGDQAIIDALSLNTIQDSKETKFSVDVMDAHTGQMLAQNVKTTGNVLHGVIHENVDVEFSALSGVNAKWNDSLNKFTYDSVAKTTTLHLADNTTVLQVGANEGEDLAMNIGDMRAHALGLDGVNVMSHERAGRAITLIDNAIDKVSTQRANLGAYQNRLEYTASNLTTASENLSAAESRIRDTDMAKEMMEFTKLNIMLQAGNSMLAQANQQPQNVLSLIR